MGEKWCLRYAPRVLLHAANLRHGTDNFTSLPKEGVLRIFYRPLKIQRLRPGLNPRTWVSEASTLPLHHRSSGAEGTKNMGGNLRSSSEKSQVGGGSTVLDE